MKFETPQHHLVARPGSGYCGDLLTSGVLGQSSFCQRRTMKWVKESSVPNT